MIMIDYTVVLLSKFKKNWYVVPVILNAYQLYTRSCQNETMKSFNLYSFVQSVDQQPVQFA